MLRRVLPVTVAAAALVAAPSTASATAPQAHVENIFFAAYSGSADLALPDGHRLMATLSEYRGASQNGWSGELHVEVTDGSCSEDSCGMIDAWGDATLTDAQVAFSRDMDSGSAVDVPLTLYTPSSSSDLLAEPTTEQVTVSITVTGTGAVTRDSSKGDMCGDGSRVCQSHRLSAQRDATVEASFDGQSASGLGHLDYDLSTDTAAPKFGPEGP